MRYSHNPEGFRNFNDIHDTSSWDEVEEEDLEETLSQQIRFHFDKDTLDQESLQLVEQWEGEILVCLGEWKDVMDTLLDKDSRISPRIKEYVQERVRDLPTFDLYTKEQADAHLISFGFSGEEIQRGNFLVVFNLPKPLGQYWWKGGVERWGNASKDVRQMVIEWGRIYRSIISVVWSATDSTRLPLERINPAGVHDPKSYYYLWEMGQAPTSRYDDDYSSDTGSSYDDWGDVA